MPAAGSFDTGISPAWHTAIVLIVLLGFSWAGSRADVFDYVGSHGRVQSYVLTMALEWATVAFIGWELRRRGGRLLDVIDGRWTRVVDALRDIGIAVAFLLVCGGIVQGLSYLLHVATPTGMEQLLPQTTLELIVWVLLSGTAGFCEEVIFRGYLRRQFSALTRSAVGGILLQAIAFGLGHGYQGWKLMALITLYGAFFGLLAQWRRSLRPGMIAHALQDTAGGVLARALTH